MKILRCLIKGLNCCEDDVDIIFNEDINILTGRNGSGKTTILKLLWYCISSNIERAISEVDFESIEICTTKYTLKVKFESAAENKIDEIVHIELLDADGTILIDKKETVEEDQVSDEANELILKKFSSSIFFPTFRRIEGGFSMGTGNVRKIVHKGRVLFRKSHSNNDIQEALQSHADMLSVGQHKFVSSISTVDIKQLLARTHSKASALVDRSSKLLTDEILSKISDHFSTHRDSPDGAGETLETIKTEVTQFEESRDNAFKSLDVLSEMIIKVFHHKGIKISPRLTFGDFEESINSDLLSAGEKQMLSFLCYNALYESCPVFIDEPELSLHVDWQRILLNVLVEQDSQNQYFIATHSPFIYAQYEDKEVVIGQDKGE